MKLININNKILNENKQERFPQELFDFLEENFDVIDREDWQEFFVRAALELPDTPKGAKVRCSIRKILKDVGIADPLPRIDFIPSYYFAICNDLTAYKLNPGTQAINKFAFSQCGKLEKIILCDDLLDIGEYAFLFCDKLHYIELPSSLEFIHSYAFQNSGLTKCRYLGTKAQFEQIELGDNIFYKAPLTHIDCDDGLIDIDPISGNPIL